MSQREGVATGIGAAGSTTTGLGTGGRLPTDDAALRGLAGRDRALDDDLAERPRTYADTTKPVR